MSLIAWLSLGLVAGFVGSKLRRGTSQGMLPDIAFGVLTALAGGSFLLSILKRAPVIDFDARSLIVAAVGASVVLWIDHAVVVRRTP